MIDYVTIAQRKTEVAGRLIAALYKIKRRNIPRLEQRILENLAECVTPARAYRTDRDMYLPHGRPVRNWSLHASKMSILFHEAHQAVILYWELIRTDEATGLERMIKRLEYYAANGYKGCGLLGGSSVGYTLFRPEVK